MKKILLPILAVAFNFLSADAQQQESLFIQAGEFKNISVAENMNVVLMPAKPGQNEMKVDKKVSEKLRVTLEGSSIVIAAQKFLSKDVTIYIIVNELNTLTVGQNSVIHTKGILMAEKPTLFLDEGAIAHLRTTGKIKAYSLGDFDITIKHIQIKNNPTGTF